MFSRNCISDSEFGFFLYFWASNMYMVLSCDAGHGWRATAPSQPHGHEGKPLEHLEPFFRIQ